MREFVVSRAPVTRVARQVRETVEDAGGIVANHTAHKTEFDHLDYGDHTWRRAGYVGTYQRFKEKPVRVRIRVWAQWPRRLLVGSVYLGLVEAIGFFVASLVGVAIPPNAWIFTALPTLAAIATSLLIYTSSIPDSEAAEERIEADLSERIAGDEQIPGEIFDVDAWEDHRKRLIREAREEAKSRLPHGGSKVRKAVATARSSITEAVPIGSGADLPAPSEARAPPEGDAEEEPGADGEPGSGDRFQVVPDAQESEQEPARAQTEEEEPEDGGSSFTDRLPFVGSSGDDEPTGQPPEESPEEDDGEEGTSLADRIPFLGSSEPSDEDEEEASQEPDEPVEEGSSRSFVDRIPLLGSSEEDTDEEGDEGGEGSAKEADEDADESREG